MQSIRLLIHDGEKHLGELAAGATSDLLIAAPYVTDYGTNHIINSLSSEFRRSGRLTLLTDLSPLPICQGSTDPKAVRSLLRSVANSELFHLPRLHAKVFVADSRHAIVTSANLSAGGMKLNHEYGVELNEADDAATARRDMGAYLSIAAAVEDARLDAYIAIADEVRERFRAQQESASREARDSFSLALGRAEDELIRLRLQKGPMAAVFAATILYLLRSDGPLSTPGIHQRIEQMHPDLCDNSVYRVIDGRHFGRKWKHSVRTAQYHLKTREEIELVDGRWKIKE